MDSSRTQVLISLLVFQSTVNEEQIRSLHVYRSEDGKEYEVGREFLVSAGGSYTEMEAHPALILLNFRVSEVFEGLLNGFWLCVFAFHADCPPCSTCIPSPLTMSRNLNLNSVPILARDLEFISQLGRRIDGKEASQFPTKEMCQQSDETHHKPGKSMRTLYQDLNCLPYPIAMPRLSEDKQKEHSPPGIVQSKKKRAASESVARIALSDLVKHFDLPIVEASRNLKVGLTVLKKKCREYGITRWPHRKLKSLDNLIQDLQEEAKRQEREDEAAAMAVAKRQRMLESEKENIERKPFIELKSETKRFRQDVFKRKHRARALGTRGPPGSSDNGRE